MSKNFDILVVGELNVDLILNDIPSSPKLGTEILAHEMNLTLGSSSAIFASNISTLGAKTGFIGKIGKDDFGNLVLDTLQKKNVNTDNIIVSTEYKTGATIVLNYDEDRAMVTHPGAMEKLFLSDIKEDVLKTAKHMHVSSVFLQPGIKNDIVEIFALAKKNGLTTSLDLQWDPDEKWDLDFPKLLPLVDVFLPNNSEIMAITNKNSVESALDSIKDHSNIIAIKMGNKGSMGYLNNEIIKVEPFLNKNVVDAIGAGDSFNSGFVSQFIKGEPLEKCLQFGNLTGALNTTASGGTGAFESLQKVKELASERFGFQM